MPQCSGTTAEGVRCRNIVRRGRKFCHLHEDQADIKQKQATTRILKATIPLGLLSLLAVLADLSGVLGFFGLDLPIFNNEPPDNIVSIGRDLLDSIIIY